MLSNPKKRISLFALSIIVCLAIFFTPLPILGVELPNVKGAGQDMTAQEPPVTSANVSGNSTVPGNQPESGVSVSGEMKENDGGEGRSPELRAFWSRHRDILPWDYAHVKDIPTPVYKMALASTEGVEPVAMLDGGPGAFRWVSLEEPFAIKSGEKKWFIINPSQYVEAVHLERFWPSTFRGINLKEHPLTGRHGWVVFDSYASTKPGAVDYFDGRLIKKHTLVTIYETRHINGWDWHRISENEWLEQRRIALIKRSERPEEIPEGAKWIDVNLFEQTITAYEGDDRVYVSLISSGLPGFDTEQGLFRIWAKVRFAKMGGGEKGKDFYWLEDVPYHMYFFQGFAIHGAYWHNNFGVKQSHGCVNISCLDAYWFFNWTEPQAPGDKWVVKKRGKNNTWVWVHE